MLSSLKNKRKAWLTAGLSGICIFKEIAFLIEISQSRGNKTDWDSIRGNSKETNAAWSHWESIENILEHSSEFSWDFSIPKRRNDQLRNIPRWLPRWNWSDSLPQE